VDGYQIFRDNSPTPIATTTLLTYVDSGLAPLSTHTYALKSFDPSGNYSNLSQSVSVTTTRQIAVPDNLKASAISYSEIDLSWSASSDPNVVSYKVFRGGLQVATTTATSFKDLNLSPALSYSYFVRAVDSTGVNSSPSSTVTAATLPPPPPTVPSNL